MKTASAETITPLPQLSRTPAAASQTVTKSEVLNQLKSLQTKQQDELESIEIQIKKRLKESTTLSLQDLSKQSLAAASVRVDGIVGQISTLDEKREELLARRTFTDRLRMAIDSKWNGQPLRSFLEGELLDMATADLTNPMGSTPSWKFITYLSITVREIPENRENLISIVENFMTYSSVLNPKSPTDFLSDLSYTNGSSTYTARPANKDEIGEYIEKRLREFNGRTPELSKPKEIQPPSAASNSDIELRMKPVPRPTPHSITK